MSGEAAHSPASDGETSEGDDPSESSTTTLPVELEATTALDSPSEPTDGTDEQDDATTEGESTGEAGSADGSADGSAESDVAEDSDEAAADEGYLYYGPARVLTKQLADGRHEMSSPFAFETATGIVRGKLSLLCDMAPAGWGGEGSYRLAGSLVSSGDTAARLRVSADLVSVTRDDAGRTIYTYSGRYTADNAELFGVAPEGAFTAVVAVHNSRTELSVEFGTPGTEAS
jgi:hypothetical protein